MGGFTSAIGGLVGTVGGIVGGSKAADAAKGQAEALRAAADKASGMAAFTPYGTTTAFGTSQFEDGKGSYTLSPQLKALQDRLFAQAGSYDPTQIAQAAQPLYGAAGQAFSSANRVIGTADTAFGGGQNLFNIGGQYLASSPEQARQDYIAQQQGLLAGTREQQLAQLRNQQLQTGRSGLATGGTTTGMAATNPEAAAYYNAIADQDRRIAAEAEQVAQQRQAFGAGLQNQGIGMLGAGTNLLTSGTGLFGQGAGLLGQIPALTNAGYAPLQTQLGLLGTTEAMGQQPYNLSVDLANQYAQAGARQGQLYLQPQEAAARSYAQYQGYSPMAVGLQGLGQSIQSFGSPSSWTGLGGQTTGGVSGGVGNWFDNYLTRQSNQSSSDFVGPSR